MRQRTYEEKASCKAFTLARKLDRSTKEHARNDWHKAERDARKAGKGGAR